MLIVSKIKRLCMSALFLALGIVLPFFTAQIKEIGDTLLPMHIPTMLCGLICGPLYGLLVGGLLPFLRSLLFSMPPMYPNAVWMACELATYGLVIGLIYCKLNRKTTLSVYISLVAAMLSGRVVWGIAKAILLGGGKFTAYAFVFGGFVDALPGIVLQLIIIPLVVKIIDKYNGRRS